jgi:hypothetical protein
MRLLQVDSEESDFEGSDADSDAERGDSGIPVTLKMVKKWTEQLRDEK